MYVMGYGVRLCSPPFPAAEPPPSHRCTGVRGGRARERHPRTPSTPSKTSRSKNLAKHLLASMTTPLQGCILSQEQSCETVSYRAYTYPKDRVLTSITILRARSCLDESHSGLLPRYLVKEPFCGGVSEG